MNGTKLTGTFAAVMRRVAEDDLVDGRIVRQAACAAVTIFKEIRGHVCGPRLQDRLVSLAGRLSAIPWTTLPCSGEPGKKPLSRIAWRPRIRTSRRIGATPLARLGRFLAGVCMAVLSTRRHRDAPRPAAAIRRETVPSWGCGPPSAARTAAGRSLAASVARLVESSVTRIVSAACQEGEVGVVARPVPDDPGQMGQRCGHGLARGRGRAAGEAEQQGAACRLRWRWRYPGRGRSALGARQVVVPWTCRRSTTATRGWGRGAISVLEPGAAPAPASRA